MNEKLEKNKKNIIAFYDLVFNKGKPKEAAETYLGDDYMQHNPNVATGIQGFIDAFEEATGKSPANRTEFKKVFAEGDYVIVHCHHHWPNRQEYAGIDIFRLDHNGKIVEHWDVLQPIPENSVHDNMMF